MLAGILEKNNKHVVLKKARLAKKNFLKNRAFLGHYNVSVVTLPILLKLVIVASQLELKFHSLALGMGNYHKPQLAGQGVILTLFVCLFHLGFRHFDHLELCLGSIS